MAQAAPVGAQPGEGLGLRMLIPMGIMVFVFYFLLIRPQQKKAKEHDSLLKTLKSGDKVATNAGIIGVIIAVKEKSVTIRSADSKLDMLKSAVSEILERTGEGSEK
jgi:preprotein translocase subunit YajC